MISKVHHASSLDAMLRYIYQEAKSPQVISNTTMSRDMDGAREEILGEIKKHEALKRPVFHGILSLPIEESLTRTQWRRVVERYTGAMGYASSAYVAVRHFDTNHEHVHIVASRIDVSGAVVEDSLEWVRSQEILREIEREFGLQIVPNAWEVDERRMGQAEYHALQEGKALESDREGARAAIYAALGEAESVEDFVATLGAHGVSIIPRVEPTGEVMGLAFKSGERFFAGHRVSRAYSWPRLKERIGYEHARDFDALVRAPAVIERSTPAPEAKALARESREDLLGGEEPPRHGRVPEPAREESAPSRVDVLAPDRQRAPLARVPEGRQGAPAFVARPVPVLSQDEEAARAKREELLALARDPMVSRGVRDVEGHWRGDVKDGERHWGVIEKPEGERVLVSLDGEVHVGDGAYGDQTMLSPVRKHEGVGELRAGDIVTYWSSETASALVRAPEFLEAACARKSVMEQLARFEARGVPVARDVESFRGDYVGRYTRDGEQWLVLEGPARVGVIRVPDDARIGDMARDRDGGFRAHERYDSLERFERGDRVTCSRRGDELHISRKIDAHRVRVEQLIRRGWVVNEDVRRVEGSWGGSCVDERGRTWALVVCDDVTKRASTVRLEGAVSVEDGRYDERTRLVSERELDGTDELAQGDLVVCQREKSSVAIVRVPEPSTEVRERARMIAAVESKGRIRDDSRQISGEYKGHYTDLEGERWLVLQSRGQLERVRVPEDARVGDAVWAQGERLEVRERHDDLSRLEAGDAIACSRRGDELHISRRIDEKIERCRELEGAGFTIKGDVKKVEGTWEGAHVDRQGERWGFVRDEQVIALVRLDEQTRVGDGAYNRQAELVPVRQHEGTRELRQGEIVKYWSSPTSSALVRVPEREECARQRHEIEKQLDVAKREGVEVRIEREASGTYRTRFTDPSGKDWLVLEQERARVLVRMPDELRVGDVTRDVTSGEQIVKEREERFEHLKVGDSVEFKAREKGGVLLREVKEHDRKESHYYVEVVPDRPLHLDMASGKRVAQAMDNDVDQELERLFRQMNIKYEPSKEKSAETSAKEAPRAKPAPVKPLEKASARETEAAPEVSGESVAKVAPSRVMREMREGEQIEGVVSAVTLERGEQQYRVLKTRDEDILVPEQRALARHEGKEVRVETYRLPDRLGYKIRGLEKTKSFDR